MLVKKRDAHKFEPKPLLNLGYITGTKTKNFEKMFFKRRINVTVLKESGGTPEIGVVIVLE